MAIPKQPILATDGPDMGGFQLQKWRNRCRGNNPVTLNDQILPRNQASPLSIGAEVGDAS